MADSYEDLGGDAMGERIFKLLREDYAAAGKPMDDGTGVWPYRTAFDAQLMDPEASLQKHRAEWREALGLPVADIAPIAPHEYAGNLCGVHVAGAPPVPGGAEDPSLILSWFYDRYPPEWREQIRAVWGLTRYPDVALGWGDSRGGNGASPESFRDTCMELVAHGFRPNVFLLSKVFDPHNDVAGCKRNIDAVLPLLLSPRAVSRIMIAWEMGIDVAGPGTPWLTSDESQQLIDYVAPQCVAAGVKCYVHFPQGWSHYPSPALPNFAAWWRAQQGKLTGVMHQRLLEINGRPATMAEYRGASGGLTDILDRFNGDFGTPTDNGIDGHPFDCVALEITAQPQFNGDMAEITGNEWGRWAIKTPPVGIARVMGSGNGS